jgi:hypothetical protein
MSLEQAEANRLLCTPKKVWADNRQQEEFYINPFDETEIRLNLVECEDEDSSFLLKITKSEKRRIKVTLHHQENDSDFCLVRIDYNGSSHTNPVIATELVPEHFLAFAGETITDNHIHYHVEGYRSAQWAIPLEISDFPFKTLDNDEYSVTFADIITEFCKLINLKTRLTYQTKFFT